MKKRFKMIITVAMLACSMALMGFGVYAASSHTLTVNNYIQFSVGDNIAVKFEAKSAIAAPQKYSTATGTKTHTATAGVTSSALDNPTWEPWTDGSPAIMTVGNETMYWIFKVTNQSTSNAIKVGVYAAGEGTTALSEPTGYTLNVKYATSDILPATALTSNQTASIAAGGVNYILVQLTVNSNTTNIAKGAFNFKLVATKA